MEITLEARVPVAPYRVTTRAGAPIEVYELLYRIRVTPDRISPADTLALGTLYGEIKAIGQREAESPFPPSPQSLTLLTLLAIDAQERLRTGEAL